MTNKTPQLRICVTPSCNLHCLYCMPGGEGYFDNPSILMTREEIHQILVSAVNNGFTHVKFTGGEPLYRTDIFDIISDAKKVKGLEEVQMVTNGTLLPKFAQKIKDAGLDVLTISIDAVDQEIYRKIRGGDLMSVIKGLEECQEINLPVRINTVLMKSNRSQVEPLINLASRTGASLKFLDLYDLQHEGQKSFDFWKSEFLHFSELRGQIENLGGVFTGYEEAPGGIGAPLLEFRMPNGLQVVLKDATAGTFYATYCFDCKFYPCQDALISLRVTHDGNLKMCLIRNDNLLDLLTPLRNGDLEAVSALIKDRLDILTSAVYYPHKWIPLI